MKRFSKLSLVAIVALSSIATVANATENLAEAFKNSKVSGEVKAAYVNSNFLGSQKKDSISAVGGKLGIVTDSFYGLKAGATFQTSTVLHDGIDHADSSIMDPVKGVSKRVNFFDASGSVLSESYLQYNLSNTSLKVGRQFIHTPIVSSGIDGKSSEAIIKDSFEAYVLKNTDLPNTTLVAGYITKYQAQTDNAGNPGKFNKFQDGAYTIYAQNKSIENLTLQLQYLDEKGVTSAKDKDVLYFQADYNLYGHTLSAQYLASTDKTQASNAQDGKIFGLKATGPLGIWKLGYLVAYNSSTDKNAAVYTGAGEGTTDTLFTAMPVHDGGVPSRANTDTVVGALVVPVAGATVIGYAGKSSSSTHVLGDVTAMGAMVIYPINKNLLLKVDHEHVECQKLVTRDTDTTRVYLTYKF
jgi:hypothetical protein